MRSGSSWIVAILKPHRIVLPNEQDLELIEPAVSQTPNGPWSPAALQRPSVADGEHITGKIFHNKAGWSTCVTDMGGRHTNELVENCIFTMRGNPHGRWLERMYSTQGIVRHVIYEDVAEEHARYTKLAKGYTLMHDILCRRVHSQAYQQRVDDLPEQSYADWFEEKTLHLRDWVALECCTDKGTRPAFIISPKSAGPNSDLILENLFLQTVKQPNFQYNGITYNSYGGVCVELWRSARLYNVRCELKRPRNTGFQFYDYGAKYQSPSGILLPRRAPAYIEIDGVELWGGNIELRPQWHDYVRIRPGKGDGHIRSWKWINGDWRLDPNHPPIPVGVGYAQG